MKAPDKYADNLRWVLDLVCDAMDERLPDDERMKCAEEIAGASHLYGAMSECREYFRNVSNKRTDTTGINHRPPSHKERREEAWKNYDLICRDYYINDRNINQISKGHKISQKVVNEILDKHGATFHKENREEIERDKGWR
jgi:hypothetical protein